VTATTVEVATGEGLQSDPALPFFLERYASAYRAELDAFIDAVRDGDEADPSGEDGLAALLLADAATHSARTGERIVLSSASAAAVDPSRR
jgi:myo-inositol 2-dehydrogenase/D-chiro-inositol 1-dehydrogenase